MTLWIWDVDCMSREQDIKNEWRFERKARNILVAYNTRAWKRVSVTDLIWNNTHLRYFDFYQRSCSPDEWTRSLVSIISHWICNRNSIPIIIQRSWWIFIKLIQELSSDSLPFGLSSGDGILTFSSLTVFSCFSVMFTEILLCQGL